MPTSPRTYDLHVPVWKQGDDLAYHLGKVKEESPDKPMHIVGAEAFKRLAEQYEAASQVCRRAASVCAETEGAEVSADCHYIGITGPRGVLDPLTTEDEGQLLSVSPCEEDEESDED